MHIHLPRIAALGVACAITASACFSSTPPAAPSPSAAAAAADGAEVTTGSNVKATLSGDLASGTKNVSITFASVIAGGKISAVPATSVPQLPAGFSRTAAFDITTTARFDRATVCFENDNVRVNSKLYHFTGNTWNDRTTTVAPPRICGDFTSFSPVAIVEGQAAATATATAAPTTAPTPTPTEAATATPTATAAATTAAATATATKTPTPTTAATKTPAPTATPKPSPTPTPTPSPTPTPTPTPLATLAPTAPATGLVITGKVTDAATGAALQGVCVYVGVPGSRCWATTDPIGNFYIDLGALLVPSGQTWELFFAKSGYPTQGSPKFVLSAPVVVNHAMTK